MEKPRFTSLFSSLEAPKQSQEHSPFAASNLSLLRQTRSLLVHGAQSSSDQCPARPTEKQSRASIIETSTIRRANKCTFSGASANTGPHYQKLYARVIHIWGNCKGQPDPSAMKGPHLERTASLITVPPASGKFFLCLRWTAGRPFGECNAHQPTDSSIPKGMGPPKRRVHQNANFAEGSNLAST